jgi:hypothetical protein
VERSGGRGNQFDTLERAMTSTADPPIAQDRANTLHNLHWILRIAVAAEFIGHGAFGILGKDAWLAYYDVVGIDEPVARILMPLTGTMDVTLGVLVLLWPMRALLAYMAFWGLFTATLRPLAGEGLLELVERAYNFGVPLALLILVGFGRSPAHWLARIGEIPRLARERARLLAWVLRGVIAGMLIGHGGLALITDKQLFIRQYESIGLTALVDDPRTLNVVVGSFEIALGVAAFAFPATLMLVFVAAWKVATELLFVTMDAYGSVFEVIERGGAYAAPLALILVRTALASPDETPAEVPAEAAESRT